MNNLQNELNTMLKTFDDKPTIKLPQSIPQQETIKKEAQKNQNIKIEMH